MGEQELGSAERVMCSCGCWWVNDGRWFLVPPEEGGVGQWTAYCVDCDTRLSFDDAGKPVMEAMVPAAERDHYRRALEWFIGQYWPERVDELVGVALAATKEGETDAITPAR